MLRLSRNFIRERNGSPVRRVCRPGREKYRFHRLGADYDRARSTRARRAVRGNRACLRGRYFTDGHE